MALSCHLMSATSPAKKHASLFRRSCGEDWQAMLKPLKVLSADPAGQMNLLKES
jgi:hypothetical protein